MIWRNPAIKYGLGNLIENAADFARSRVDIEARWGPARWWSPSPTTAPASPRR
jgi:hypothetical protein